MFSGLTNQVTSWVGGKKGDQEEGANPAASEVQPAPPQAEAQAPATGTPVAEDADKQRKKRECVDNIRIHPHTVLFSFHLKKKSSEEYWWSD
ncbi:hypothetical protein DMENIID0001_127310 [Sergentomyia squamirostris]